MSTSHVVYVCFVPPVCCLSPCFHSEFKWYIFPPTFLTFPFRCFTGISSWTHTKLNSWFQTYSATIISSFIFLRCKWRVFLSWALISETVRVDYLSHLLICHSIWWGPVHLQVSHLNIQNPATSFHGRWPNPSYPPTAITINKFLSSPPHLIHSLNSS